MRFWAKKVRFWAKKNAKLGIGLAEASGFTADIASLSLLWLLTILYIATILDVLVTFQTPP